MHHPALSLEFGFLLLLEDEQDSLEHLNDLAVDHDSVLLLVFLLLEVFDVVIQLVVVEDADVVVHVQTYPVS